MVVFPGVLRPPSDARLLIDAMKERGLAEGASVLDVFTGTGVLAIAAALQGAGSVTATDISRRAVLNARLNARLNGVRVKAVRGDLFAPVRGLSFDLVVANPPYVPSMDDELPSGGARRAWDAGRDGRLLIDRFCASVSRHLTAGGHALVVHSSLCDEQSTRSALIAAGLQVDVASRQRGPLGPITEGRAAMLERRGLLAPGQREEELLVIHARRGEDDLS
jgi:release factor glutamine methyltransferase